MGSERITEKKSLEEIVAQLRGKFAEDGQNLESYLEGLLLSNYLNYWDYIKLDTLLSLQQPKTNFPDEYIFVVYHQIAELYFNLILFDIKQLGKEPFTQQNFENKLQRISNYIQQILNSFEDVIGSITKEQFFQFRNALMPASGFQSFQFREIEFAIAPLQNLLESAEKQHIEQGFSIEENYQKVYWKKGSCDAKTGKKTLTLVEFEQKYDTYLLNKINEYQSANLFFYYQKAKAEGFELNKINVLLKEIDEKFNVHFALIHYKAAAKHLRHNAKDVASTGGTNWQQYLPPRFQRIIFFPELWTVQEKEEWGKKFVDGIVL